MSRHGSEIEKQPMALRQKKRRCVPLPLNMATTTSTWLADWLLMQTNHKVALDAKQGIALANLIPALLCGEQSAVGTFSAQAQHEDEAGEEQSAKVLRAIACDELQHEQALDALLRSLPETAEQPAIQRQARQFYLSLGRNSSRAGHFFQISILDKAVSVLMHSVEQSVIGNDRVLKKLFCHIKQDEARHAHISKQYAHSLGVSKAEKNYECERIHSGLMQLLRPLAPYFSQIGIEPAQLMKRISRCILP